MKILDEIFNEAYSYFIQKKFSDSIICLRRSEQYAESLSPEFQVVAENLKGFSYLGLSEINRARECFEKALNADPSSSQACAGLGEAFYLDKQDSQAKTMFEYAVVNNPENQLAISGLAKVNDLLNLPQNHNSLIAENTVKPPDFRNVIIESSELFANGQFAQAIDGIISIEGKIENDLIDLKELLTELLNMKATAYLNLNELEEARSSFEKALNISPDSSTACWGLAEIFFRNAMYNEAKTMYEWALRHNENNVSAKEGLYKVNQNLAFNENIKPKSKPALRLSNGRTVELD